METHCERHPFASNSFPSRPLRWCLQLKWNDTEKISMGPAQMTRMIRVDSRLANYNFFFPKDSMKPQDLLLPDASFLLPLQGHWLSKLSALAYRVVPTSYVVNIASIQKFILLFIIPKTLASNSTEDQPSAHSYEAASTTVHARPDKRIQV